LLWIIIVTNLVTAHAGESDPPVQQETGIANVSFGFKAGLGLSQHSGIEERDAEYEVSSEWRSGFAVSVFLYLPITSRLGLQQEVQYVQKGSKQAIDVTILDIPTVLDVTYEMDYVEIPVMLKFGWFLWNDNRIYSLAGTGLCFKVRDRYQLNGVIDDGTQQVPLSADSDMSEVEMFDYSFVYGFGLEYTFLQKQFLVEYRFAIGWNRLLMPTYAYVPFGDERLQVNEDSPVSLKNQNHLVLIGITF
jgi:hypothetical protein